MHKRKDYNQFFFILLFRPQKIVSLKDRLANFELACKDSNMSPNNIAFSVCSIFKVWIQFFK